MREIITLTSRYHFIHTSISKMKKTVHTNVHKDGEQLEFLYAVHNWKKYKVIQLFRKMFGSVF